MLRSLGSDLSHITDPVLQDPWANAYNPQWKPLGALEQAERILGGRQGGRGGWGWEGWEAVGGGVSGKRGEIMGWLLFPPYRAVMHEWYAWPGGEYVSGPDGRRERVMTGCVDDGGGGGRG